MEVQATAEPEVAPEHAMELRAGHAEEVLLVCPCEERTAWFHKILASIPDGGPYGLVSAGSLKTGLLLLGSGRFSIAFVDVSLGPDSGVELIRAAGGRLCPTPMVLLSDGAGTESEQAGFSAGAVDIVDQDDLSPSALRRVVRSARFSHETTRRLIVEERRHRDLAANASAASSEKTRFLAHMSHELRTPLNAILGFSEVIRNEMFGEIEGAGADRYREYIGDIHDSSRHLLSLINDLLDLAKIEAGRCEIAPVEIPVSDVVADVRRMVQRIALDKGIELHLALPAGRTEVHADRRLIMQALLNIVSNAIKFTPRGGRVALAARSEGRNLVIAVSDNGPGISPEDLRHVFEPFRQAGALETRPDGGTGLGLPLSRSIMELHQGGLEIVSEPGEGTTVSIWLPRNMHLVAGRSH